MFSALRKLWVQLLGGLHDLIDSKSDAGRTARQGVREITNQIGLAEESITDVAAQKRLMEADRDKAHNEAAKWGQLAKQAADAGDHEGAIEAVHKQVNAEEQAQAYAAHVEHLAPKLQQLQARLATLRTQKRDMEHKTSLLDARSKVADAEARAARYLGNVGAAGGVDFEQLDKNVSRKEAKAAALADMAQDKAAGNVETRLADHARREAIAGKLTQLGLQAVEPTRTVKLAGEGNNA